MSYSEYNVKIYRDEDVIGFVQTFIDKPHPLGLPGELDIRRLAVYNAKLSSEAPEHYNIVKYLRDQKIPLRVEKEHVSGRKWIYEGCWVKEVGQTCMTNTITVSEDVTIGYFSYKEE